MNLAVVVSSCDQFRDAWAPFFHFFTKHWPDCPYPVHLITNHGAYRDPLVTCLPVGRDRHWSDNLSLALDRLPARHILYFQEDFFLTRPVRTKDLQADIDFMQRVRAAFLCLIPPPEPKELLDFEGHPRIALVAPESNLRVCLQAAVWDVAALRSLMRPGENGWDMEKFGTERSRAMRFLRVPSREASPLDYFCTAIKRGAWEPEAVDMCRRENLTLDLDFRPVLPETRGQHFRRRLRYKLDRYRQILLPRRFEVRPFAKPENTV